MGLHKTIDTILSIIPYIFEIVGKTNIQVQTTVNPGNGVTDGNGYVSAGFRCKYNGGAGFVTTFHSSTVGTAISDSSGNTLGDVIVAIHNSYEDFAFVRMYEIYGNTFSLHPLGNSNYTLSTNYVTTALAQNYPVRFAGKNTTYVRTGTVYCFDYSMSTVPSHWILCDYNSYSGDSGGCIFTELNGSYWVIGVHDGRYGDATSSHAYGTKFSVMKSCYSSLILY